MTSRAPSGLRWMVLGFVLLQLAWILAVPPFRGSDEWDHAYRAAAVAHGQWLAEPSAATRGTGATLDVPRDIVEAARPECQDLLYTVDSDCVGEPADRPGFLEVSSGAGRYNPAFYAVVGTAALPFDGYAALYAMRAASALLAVLFLLAAAWITLAATRTRWPAVGLTVALTPVLVYSTIVAAPNGVEMTAGLALWAALLALARGAVDHPRTRLVAVAVAVAASGVLVLIRSLGGLWFGLVVACVVALVVSPESWRDQLRSLTARKDAVIGMVTVGALAIAGLAWTLSQGSYHIGRAVGEEPVGSFGEAFGRLIDDPILWVFQSVAAFPYRNDEAHVAVYVLALGVFLPLLVHAIRRGARRYVAVMLAAAVLALLVPLAITLLTYGSFGDVWQGRYTLPFAVGVPLLAGWGLELSTLRRTLQAPVFAGAVLMLGIAHVWSIVGVRVKEAGLSPLDGTDAWWTTSPVLIGAVAAVGWALLTLGVWTSRSSSMVEPVWVPEGAVR